MSWNCILMYSFWLASSTVTSQANWIELPKLQPEDFRDRVNKWAVIEGRLSVEPVASTPMTTTVSPGKLDALDDNYRNKSYSPFESNIESLLIDVHRSLVAETKKSLPQKINFLRRLRNNILDQIWRRSQSLWTVEQGRGDVSEFPSLEGALMTISVLTFAVFLIKIVSQFIQGLQGANATTMTVTNPTGTRFKRDNALPLSDAAIIKLIEEFQVMHGN